MWKDIKNNKNVAIDLAAEELNLALIEYKQIYSDIDKN
jgi:hypothetical protein